MFGNKIDASSGAVIEANGIIEEFEISVNHGAIPIPIGATDFTARKIWETVISDFGRYVPQAGLEDKYQLLGDVNQTDEALINTVIEIVNMLEKEKGNKEGGSGMARKTFISYKYSEAQHTRDRIIKALGTDARYYQGETSTSPNLTDRKTETIKNHLKSMILILR